METWQGLEEPLDGQRHRWAEAFWMGRGTDLMVLLGQVRQVLSSMEMSLEACGLIEAFCSV